MAVITRFAYQAEEVIRMISTCIAYRAWSSYRLIWIYMVYLAKHTLAFLKRVVLSWIYIGNEYAECYYQRSEHYEYNLHNLSFAGVRMLLSGLIVGDGMQCLWGFDFFICNHIEETCIKY